MYYALLIGLHDGAALIKGTPKPISQPIGSLHEWMQWLVKTAYCPECMDDDKADFIKDALRQVEADLHNSDREGGEASDFDFKPGQVLYKGNDLELPTGLAIEVFQKLVNQFEAN